MNSKYLFELLRRATPEGMPPSQRRRAVLRIAAALAASTVLSSCAPVKIRAQPRFSSYPFALGVASGSPRPDGFVLWTRLAPEPLAGGGMPEENVELAWELAADEGFRHIVRTGTATAIPALAHSAHVELTGLEPARWYWYRFTAGDAMSPIGRTRTAPADNAVVERLRFAFASCQQYEQGYFAAHRHLAAEDLDLIVFLGDYIYESSWGRNHVRKHNAGEPYTLSEYRNRYALYKSDSDLQRSHAIAPWIVTWDDHEVDNDYANDRSEDLDPKFLTRRAAAYQAYYEHMPLALRALPRGPDAQLYDSYAFGDLATFFVLDDRQYRAHQACPKPGRGGSNVVEDCAERLAPGRTMLGAAQEAWLRDGLARSRAKWNVIAQQTLMAQLDRKPGPGRSFWNDGWDGYPAARARLLNDIAQLRPSNPLVISGDVHCHWVADLKPDFDAPQSPVVATEFCGASITSQDPSPKQVLAWLAENPHLRYGNGTQRGYVKMEISRDACTATLRALDSEKRADSDISTLATFVVGNGHPGAQRA
jgi:alkaline phosphatase D